tara:strand:+ start:245 stop:631 length:387 start_codon:yes stop_codon:yes gene_type:complete
MILSSATYQVRRYERTVVDGVIQVTEILRFEVNGSLQPATDEELIADEAGWRPRGAFKLYTSSTTNLRMGGTDRTTGESYEPDRVEWDGRFLYVHGVEDYKTAFGLLPHRKWILVEPEIEVGAFTEEC